ncbi:CYTH domain-containing protein [Marinobacter sp. LV10R510-11A]|uniref:CYTH domain-containing protein n=1 Tax=Marinobacter sp. LV10R510-11A TaxID=1415568 RepID=UPI000BB7AA6E|nr:CYTH domain-containing protein [Marinobacter sp. LV10R510-11A]SOB76700.1 CYTH domain-containing protein [Marinobacter sp. LV10R510-11A]
MAEELEIKLSLEPGGLIKALSWLQAQPEATKGDKKSLVNSYYDTPDAELNHQQAALRVRQAGDRYIQTLKTRGEFVNGAHRREEWEWPLPGPSLSLGLLADTPLGDRINLARLAPVFETNFTRQVVMLDDGEAVIECAVDDGVVIASPHTKPLHEVEFELVSGDPSRLLVWAKRLAQTCPVFLNLISKAEQGYHLAGIHKTGAVVTEHLGANASEHDDLDRLLQQLSNAWLEQKAVSFEGLDLQLLGTYAEASGLGQTFSALLERLANGEAPSELLGEPELGQCQLGLLANREKQSSGWKSTDSIDNAW